MLVGGNGITSMCTVNSVTIIDDKNHEKCDMQTLNHHVLSH